MKHSEQRRWWLPDCGGAVSVRLRSAERSATNHLETLMRGLGAVSASTRDNSDSGRITE